MTENEAKEMLKAKLTCMKLELMACTEKGCDRNCFDCAYNYAQGTMGEQKEALKMAIKVLEELQQYRAIGTVEGYENAIKVYTETYILMKEYKSKLQDFEVIGTVEEFKALKEKNEPKMMDGYYCPICRHYFEAGELFLFCPCCGQKLDWQ